MRKISLLLVLAMLVSCESAFAAFRQLEQDVYDKTEQNFTMLDLAPAANMGFADDIEGDGKGGTYFGATGCGKTYTMLFLSRLMMLRRSEELGNPTIVIIVDREDLDNQTSELFVTAKRFLHDENVRSIETRDDLAETLRGRESGGV